MSELPKGWKVVKFEALYDFVIGGDWGKAPDHIDAEFVDVRCIRGTEFRYWAKEKGKTAVPRRVKKSSLEKRKLELGDILVEISGGGPEQPVGRTVQIDQQAISNANGMPLVCTNFTRLVRPSNQVNSAFLNYFLTNFYNSGEITKYQSGSNNLRNLQFKDYVKIGVPLAPLAEQKRIVEKLDEVLAQVDTIKARLDGIPAILKRFRQSVLASAVSGKLTEDSNADWVGCHLSDVSTFQNGYAFKSGWFSDEGDYQVIKLGNVKDDFLKLDAAPAYLSSKLGLEHIKFKPEIGDILLSMTGTKFKRDYGFCCMVDRELPILINQRVGRIIPKRDKVMPDFLHLFLRSEVFRNQFFAGETGGVNQGNVGSKHIMAIQLSVPDLELQIEIAKKARLLFTFADTIEAQVKKAQARVDNLTQSILAKAFRGELVPQDPNDEPADKLLERIAQARKEAEALAKAAKKAQSTKNTAKKKVAKSA
ncbi:restriction endonuclease subunit S [Vibrio vulnificus]